MEMKDFFDFGNESSSSTVQAHAVGLVEELNVRSDRNNLIRGEYKDIHFPVIFKQEYGRKLTDILGTGWVSLYLISDRMKKILEDNHFTGWKTFPIKLYDKKGNEIFGYHGFSVTGRCGPVFFKKERAFEKQFVSTGPTCKFYKGIFFDLNKWDGTDFFIPAEKLYIFITKKVADILVKNKITNLYLDNLFEHEIDSDLVKENELI